MTALPIDDTVARDQACTCAREALSAADRDEMLALLSSHFDGVTAAQFARDLDEKQWVLRIRRDGRLVGFTTARVARVMLDGASVHVLSSGDTIMAPEAWGSPMLSRAWIAMVHQLQHSTPGERWLWLLLTSGYRTYRFLPVFWRAFWPRHDAVTPADVQRTLAALARVQYGAQFDEARGIVRFTAPQRLRGALAIVDPARTTDPHVAFFLAANPGHALGDELVCLTELSDANLTAAGQRMVRQPAVAT